jgi:hypothetical protein
VISFRAVRTFVRAVVVLTTTVAGVVLAAPQAGATHPGATHPGHDGRIAFVRANQIYTMTPSGTRVRKLTTSGKNHHPTWSPDGKRLAYIHGAGGRRNVWVMGSHGAHKTPVTRSGDVTSTEATWSPNGKRLALATSQLVRIRSRAPFGSPQALNGLPTGGVCDGEGETGPEYVDRFVTWSPRGRIAVLDHSDCYYDDRIDMYHPATGELRQYLAGGADCCGYRDWTDLFWGPKGQFGYTDQDLGPYGEDVDTPTHIVYPGFASHDDDTGGAPSPSGRYLALTNTASKTPKIVRANADGTKRVVLACGRQPDWRPRP